jgi:hypothetical protein
MAGPMNWLTLVMSATLPVSFTLPRVSGISGRRKTVLR